MARMNGTKTEDGICQSGVKTVARKERGKQMKYSELIGMYTEDAIKQIDNDTIKVCCENGSAFWFVGNKDIFLKNIDELSAALENKQDMEIYRKYGFVPLKERKVVDCFKANKVVDKSVVIYLEGNDNGQMWFVGDKPNYENGRNLLKEVKE